MGKNILKNYFIFLFCLISILFWSNTALGGVMSGSSFQMDSDVIGFGGNWASSSLYFMNDTIGGNVMGYSTSTSYSLNAGFLQMDSTISLSVDTQSVVMSPSLGGLTGGYSNGSVTVNVITDNSAGYSLYIAASTSPAMQSVDDTFADYSPSGASPDYDFSVTSIESAFGFSPNGADIDARYKNDGASTCGIGSTITSLKCWDGLSTSQNLVAGSGLNNSPAGTDTIINFRAGVGSSRVQTNGWYYATTTITVIAL